MPETPGRQLPVITEATVVRTNIGTLVVLVGSVLAAAAWGMSISAGVADLAKRLSRIESAVGIDSWRFIPSEPVTEKRP